MKTSDWKVMLTRISRCATDVGLQHGRLDMLCYIKTSVACSMQSYIVVIIQDYLPLATTHSQLCTNHQHTQRSARDQCTSRTDWYAVLSHCDSRGVYTMQSSRRSSARPAQHLRPSGVLGCWPDGLELTPRFYPGSNAQHRLFQASASNVLVRALLVHPAHWRFLTIMRYTNLLTHSLTGRTTVYTRQSVGTIIGATIGAID